MSFILGLAYASLSACMVHSMYYGWATFWGFAAFSSLFEAALDSLVRNVISKLSFQAIPIFPHTNEEDNE